MCHSSRYFEMLHESFTRFGNHPRHIYATAQQKKLPAMGIHDFGIAANDLWEVVKGWRLGPWL